jgi:hypothetical protein
MSAVVSYLSKSFGFSGSAEEIASGRRRTMFFLGLIAFGLATGAADGPDWVLGGIEFTAPGDNTGTNLHWHLDLLTYSFERNLAGDIYSPNGISSIQSWTRRDYVNRIISQASYVSPTGVKCTRGSTDPGATGPNVWCGLAVTAFNKDLDAVYGLLTFASILSFASFFGTLLLSSGLVTWFQHPLAFKILGGVIGASSFFSFLAVVVFAGANIKGAFCSAFDPDLPNVYCGYYTSFFVAISSVVFTALQTALFWFWLPWTLPPASESAGAFSGAAASAFSSKATEFESAAPVKTTGTSAYQEI